MAGACVNRPHRETGSTPGVAMRPSRFLRGAIVGFIGIAGMSVFQCVFAHMQHSGHAAVASVATIAALGLLALGWMRRQPVALELHGDSLTLLNRTGRDQPMRHMRIAGCAQWSGRLLALTLLDARGRREALLVAADSVDAETFRQLSVQARRAAASHL